MELRIAQTRIRVHPLMLLMIPLACRLGMQAETVSMLIALTVHEGAHLAAAAATGVSIPELTLMPFGGAARIGNPYALSSSQMGITAAAGPAANLLMILAASTLAHWGALSAGHAVMFIRINLMLMLFNLLPALPLDGGRILYALLSKRLGRTRALEAGILLGRLLAICLLCATAGIFFTRRIFNLSYIFASVFLLSAAPQERSALNNSEVHTLISALSPISAPIPVHFIAVDGACPAHRALRVVHPGSVNLFAIYSGGRLDAVTDDRSLLDLCINDGADAPVQRAFKAAPRAKNPPDVSK